MHLAIHLSALMVFPSLLGAQALATGTWPGRIEFPGGDSAVVTFAVEREQDRLRIEVVSADGTNWGLGGITEKKGRVAFTWALDGPVPMRCELSHRSDKHWEGRCDDMVRGADGKLLRLMVTLRRPDQGSRGTGD